MYNQILWLVLGFILFSSCSSLKGVYHNKENIKEKYFQFVDSEIEKINPRERFACLFPRFVNIDLPKYSKSQYPNPCSPTLFANYVLFIPDSNSYLQINILTNSDSTICKFGPKDLQKGYYTFNTGSYIRANDIELKHTKGKSNYTFDYYVSIRLNEVVKKYNICNFK